MSIDGSFASANGQRTYEKFVLRTCMHTLVRTYPI